MNLQISFIFKQDKEFFLEEVWHNIKKEQLFDHTLFLKNYFGYKQDQTILERHWKDVDLEHFEPS